MLKKESYTSLQLIRVQPEPVVIQAIQPSLSIQNVLISRHRRKPGVFRPCRRSELTGGAGTLKVDRPYRRVVCTVSGDTLVMLVMKSSRYLQACSRWVVLMMIWTSCNTHTHTHTHTLEPSVASVLVLQCSVCVWVVLCTSVSPMWGFLMRFCRQPLSVLVSRRLVDLRSMSSISVELDTQTTRLVLQHFNHHMTTTTTKPRRPIESIKCMGTQTH